MSFKCKQCGPTGPGRSQCKVITEVRDVTYLLQVSSLNKDGSKALKTVKRTYGKEIVTEDVYCSKCVPKDLIPKIIEKVERKQIIVINKVRTRSY